MTQAQAQPQPASGASPAPRNEALTGEQAREMFPSQVATALAYAAENKYFYGPKFRKLDLSWDVTGAEERAKGAVRVKLSFRPVKSFRGKAGSEYLDISPDGTIAARRALRIPSEDLPWVLIVLALLSLGGAGLLQWRIFTPGGDPLYVAGRTLYMRADVPKDSPFILFSGLDVNGLAHNWAIKTDGEGTELAYVKVTLINAQSGSVNVIIDQEAAELTTGDDLTHKPVDTIVRTFQTDSVDPRNSVAGFVPLWSPRDESGAYRAITIGAGEQIEGYLVFEVPAGSTYTEFRWKATDSAIVRYGL